MERKGLIYNGIWGGEGERGRRDSGIEGKGGGDGLLKGAAPLPLPFPVQALTLPALPLVGRVAGEGRPAIEAGGGGFSF